MPKDEFDHEDPMELVSIPLPDAEAGAEREMVRCLAEEFVRMGHRDEEILEMFRNPFYSVPHGVYLAQGEGIVKEMIAEARASWFPVYE
ncbi:MAG: hypothetical protein O2807_00670 [bacterium]|nr:hypothetical protein [bacterium]